MSDAPICLCITGIEPNEYMVHYDDSDEPLWFFSTDDACRETASVQYEEKKRLIDAINRSYFRKPKT